MRVFCFPHAGGSSFTFAKWNRLHNTSYEFYPVDYPGRGRRIGEPLLDNLEEIINDFFDRTITDWFDEPYALYGHSMGGLIVYALTRKLMKLGIPEPHHLFISGRNPPDCPPSGHLLHTLSDADFIRRLMDMGGIPSELFVQPELLRLIMPILRADCKAVETYSLTEYGKVDSPITIFYGAEDRTVSDSVAGWNRFTSDTCCFQRIPGGHFYSTAGIQKVLTIMDFTLNPQEIID